MSKLPSGPDVPPTPEEFAECFRLVGEFMFYFAALEGSLNSGVRELLHIKGLEGLVITANIQMRDKVAIVRTILAMQGTKSEEWRTNANLLLNEIVKLSEDRNKIAHNFFAPEDGGGVQIYTVKAKGRFELPTLVWSKDDFNDKAQRAANCAERLKQTVAAALTPQEGLAALFVQQPTQGSETLGSGLGLGLGLIGGQYCLAQEIPDSDPPSWRTSTRTPRAPRATPKDQKPEG